MFLPRVMRPLPTATWLTNPNVQRLAGAPFSVVLGPQGSYVAEWLAAAIEGWARWQGCVWLRTWTTQPAALAGSLTSACLYRWNDAGDQEWSRDAAPNAELDATMRLSPPGAVIVLELEGRVTSGLARLVEGIRRVACDRGVSLIAVTQRRLPAVVLRGSDCVVSAADLRDPSLISNEVAGLPGRCHDRLLRLAGRRSAVLHDVLDAARAWPSDAVVDALDASRWSRSVTDRLTANLLDLCSPGQRAALEVCVATGYWHPQLATHGVEASELRPWVVPLECQWGWLRPIWARSLERQLTGRAGRRRRLHAGGATRGDGSPHVPPAAERREPRRGVVEARLLGAFELRVDGVAITRWTGHRGTSVLRFLLARRRHACSRDELLAEFWPEVAPAAARNRLQVAVSGVRRALHEVTNLHVVEYADGEYRINPELLVEVDVERFEEALSTAGGAERSGDLEGALAAYQEAVGLYRGDFASDAPYEQWALLPRESLRITYIDALDRSSRIQLRLGRLDECIASGLRMLAVDPCREDAHRLLMRCYASQGRIYQALRQYDFCCRMLQATLETGPASQTTTLYHAIREGSALSPP
ncbi:MAG TPA: BTAD domain-containing putative transcriptional regulator [Actinomycetota bacterium]|nr:BTAD domain-containing putative transcriptional regulator [Actinomycetota bacterium]